MLKDEIVQIQQESKNALIDNDKQHFEHIVNCITAWLKFKAKDCPFEKTVVFNVKNHAFPVLEYIDNHFTFDSVSVIVDDFHALKKHYEKEGLKVRYKLDEFGNGRF